MYTHVPNTVRGPGGGGMGLQRPGRRCVAIGARGEVSHLELCSLQVRHGHILEVVLYHVDDGRHEQLECVLPPDQDGLVQVVQEVLLLQTYDHQADDHLECLRQDHGRGTVVHMVHHHHPRVAHGKDEDSILEGEHH